ncbi:helix-turn-helix domain-containing protein [Cytobacillus kochii]|uniref:helix-turn-helix domain-containing protein n=1 Tax=Cytobacillus kochii TaxID=859143 RepID=UPI00203B539D|nr:helix-turn-helix domain-containing protein [Cytobacillus kochii]MCM3323302.1 helix-turn-helix domain-containing protein [Cytobacillus kochii]MCM3345697.1 helix-turn-helix domain-containing protein [Cytobacillus kochii]
MEYLSVKELATKIKKSEETIKRWIRSGKFPNAVKNSDKQGWLIPVSEFEELNTEPIPRDEDSSINKSNESIEELVTLTYQAVTLTHPPDDLVKVLKIAGLKRTLECLLIMQQSPSKVKNPIGFIRKCLRENWTPETVAISIPKQKRRHLYDLNNQEYEELTSSKFERKVPFYNWLEED